MPLPFIAGFPGPPHRLLARFLPAVAEGVAAHYIAQHSQPREIILDPFGQSPRVALEALHLGRRVIVANFNPISHLALSLAVRPPPAAELRSALTLLADARKDDDRLETYLRGLYLTACPDCGSQVSADAFDWDLDAQAAGPSEKTILCPQCGGPPKQRPTDEADRALAQRFARGGLDYHLLLNRVAPLDDPDRTHAEEALAAYPPRALTAIAAVLVKLDALNPAPEVRRLLAGLLVAAFDLVCPLAQERPKVLAPPRRFREGNFWLALENAAGALAGGSAANPAVPLADLLAGDEAGAGPPALHAHAGPARDLAALIPHGRCALVMAALPRPNQAYWTLSALWSAWLWGRDSAAGLRSVLRRRRYDWNWHTNALRGTLSSILPAAGPTAKLIGLMGEAEPGFTGCVFAAADGAGWALEDAVLRADSAEAQFVWVRAAASPRSAAAGPLLEMGLKNTARRAARDTLLARGEPSRWISVHFGAWHGLAVQRLLGAMPDDPLGTVNRLLDPVFRDAHQFRRLGAEAEDDPATGLWYLPALEAAREEAAPQQPLADRVEGEVVRLLSTGAPVSEHDVIQAVCQAFPGPHTPGRNLVLACLNSYAQRVGTDLWQLRPEDASAQRAKELDSIQAELRALAVRHGFHVAGANPQEWRDEERAVYLFAVLTSAIISGYLLGPTPAARKRFLVLPGGRAGLAAFKLRRDPRLRAALAVDNWLIVKFRHVRRMASDTQLTRATLEPAFAGDPLDEARQLSLMDHV